MGLAPPFPLPHAYATAEACAHAREKVETQPITLREDGPYVITSSISWCEPAEERG